MAHPPKKAPEAQKKCGRPSSYTLEVAAEICEKLASGKSLIAICSAENMPHCSTVFKWLAKHPEFNEMYARAREMQADYYAAEITEIADNSREGEKVKRTATGDRCCSECDRELKWLGGWKHAADKTPICDGAKAEVVYEIETVTADMVERSKLQVDARKWLMAKLAPKRYGDRLELAGDKEAPLDMRMTVELVRSPKGDA